VIESVAGLLLPLSESLQAPVTDLIEANIMLDEITEVLQQRSNSAENEFHDLFKQAASLTELVGCEESLPPPRLAGKQMHRFNVPHSSSEEYWRRVIFIPYVTHLLSELNDRFADARAHCASLQMIIPRYLDQSRWSDVKECLVTYSDDIGHPESVVRSEYERWKVKWSSVALKDRPQQALDALPHAKLYPCIQVLLQILATLPISTATAERTYSTLRRLKTYLRSTMQEDRLNGLTHLTINRDIVVDPEKIINRLALRKRRINLVL
jgi:hypothetical protein